MHTYTVKFAFKAKRKFKTKNRDAPDIRLDNPALYPATHGYPTFGLAGNPAKSVSSAYPDKTFA